jgi:hypothetical protein
LQVHQLTGPSLAELHQAIASFAPNILYIWAGCTGHPDACQSALQQILLGGEDELLVEDLPELVSGLQLHAVILNMMAEDLPVAELRAHVPHIVRWKAGAARTHPGISHYMLLHP